MKISDSASAWRNALAVRLSSRERPAKPVRVLGPEAEGRRHRGHLILRRGLRRARQHVRAHRDLPLAIQSPDVGRRFAVCERRDVFERHAAEAGRGHRQFGNRRFRPAIRVLGAEMHLVLLAAFVVGRDLIAADQQAQCVGRIGHLHAEVRGLRPIQPHGHLGLADAQ